MGEDSLLCQECVTTLIRDQNPGPVLTLVTQHAMLSALCDGHGREFAAYS
jgi:hypothetical protein